MNRIRCEERSCIGPDKCMMMIMVESYILASVVFISVDNGKEVFKISQFMFFFVG